MNGPGDRRPRVAALMAALAPSMFSVACRAGDNNRRSDAAAAENARAGIVLPTTTRDSAGIEQLSFTAHDFARVPQLLLDSVPIAVAGGANGSGEFDLTYAREVHLLSDNRLVAFAGVGAKLMIFGADGSEQRVIGRVGRGPGEFMRPGGVVVLPGDTLFLSDVPNRRLNWVLPDGRFVRMPTMNWASLVRRGERLAGVLPDGRVVLHSSGLVPSSESDTVFRSMASVVVQPMDGESRQVAELPDLAVATINMRMRGRDQSQNVVLGFTPYAHVVLWDSMITSSSGDPYRITMRASSGAILRELSMPLQHRPVTAAMKADDLDARLQRIELSRSEGGGETKTKDESRQVARLTPYMDSLPLILAMHTSPDGTLWVVDRAAVSGIDGAVATAFRRDGAMLGRVKLAEGQYPFAFGTDRVVLRVIDDDDVVALRVHRFSRPLQQEQ